MKAKEYFEYYEKRIADGSDSNQVLVGIVRQFIDEVISIANERHVERNDGFIAIIKEQDQKWRAFARLVPDVKPSGFIDCVAFIAPDTYHAMKQIPAFNEKKSRLFN